MEQSTILLGGIGPLLVLGVLAQLVLLGVQWLVRRLGGK